MYAIFFFFLSSRNLDGEAHTDSDIEFEVGGIVNSGRYTLLYMFVNYIPGRNARALIFLSTPNDISSGESQAILVKSFDFKHQAATCKHLGLQFQRSKIDEYQPYEYNFHSIDIPEVVQDCGADRDCFYRCVTKYL